MPPYHPPHTCIIIQTFLSLHSPATTSNACACACVCACTRQWARNNANFSSFIAPSSVSMCVPYHLSPTSSLLMGSVLAAAPSPPQSSSVTDSLDPTVSVLLGTSQSGSHYLSHAPSLTSSTNSLTPAPRASRPFSAQRRHSVPTAALRHSLPDICLPGQAVADQLGRLTPSGCPVCLRLSSVKIILISAQILA